MTQNINLVKTLRETAEAWDGDLIAVLLRNSADRIEALEAENAQIAFDQCERDTRVVTKLKAELATAHNEIADMKAAAAAQPSREAELVKALRQCAIWFGEYGDHHKAKGDIDKATRNYSRQNFACEALAAYTPATPDAEASDGNR